MTPGPSARSPFDRASLGRTLVLVVAVAIIATAAGCDRGGGTSAEAIARAALLTSADFPTGEGWTDAPADDDGAPLEEQARAVPACAGYLAFQATRDDARTWQNSDDIVRSDGSEAGNQVRVMASVEEAEAAMALISDGQLAACLGQSMARLLERSDDLPPGTNFGEPTTEALHPGDLGDDALAVRALIPLNAEGIEVELVGDVVIVRVGAVLDLFLFLGVGGPLDVSRAIDASLDRLREALG